jgi:pilus assembly protein CpaF
MSEAVNSVWTLLKELEGKKGITEVVINNPKHIFVERQGQFIQLNVAITKADMYAFARDVASFNRKAFDQEHPILDGNLPDGSRINIIAEPFSTGSPAISIRKYLRSIQSFDTSPDIFGLTPKWVEFLKAAVRSRMNLIVSGGTGVGKTTFLNLLLKEIGAHERVVTIEDTIELSIGLPNVVRLEARTSSATGGPTLSIRDLVRNTLRMRPDRIIVGEARGGELFDLLQAMNTGHDGSMSSVHANSPGECLSRMETLFQLAGFDIPYHVVRRMMSSAVDMIIQISRNREGERVVSAISELTGMEGSNILSHQIALIDNGVLRSSGITPKNMETLHTKGELPMNFFA